MIHDAIPAKLWTPPRPAIVRAADPVLLARPAIARDRFVIASALPGMIWPIGAAAAAAAEFPVVQATNTGNVDTLTNPYNANLPASIASGDLLLVFVILANGTSRTITTPTNWNSLFNVVGGGNCRRFCCFWKSATGSEGATVAISANNSARWSSTSYRITGWSGSPEAGTTATGTSTNPDPASVTPSWGSTKNLFIAAAGKADGATGDFSAAPTNYSNLIEIGGGGSANSAAIGSATRELEASTDNPGTFTAPSSGWAANTVVIQPA